MPIIFLLKGKADFYLIMLASAFLHEAAHLAAAVVFKAAPDKIFLSPYGFELRIACAAPSHECLILLCGPAMSLVLAVAGKLFGSSNVFRANIYLFSLNMLSAYPLDGGRVLKIILWNVYGVYFGNKKLKKISFSVAFLLCAAGVYFASVWLFAVAFIIVSRTKKLRGTPFYRKRKKYTPVKIFKPSTPISLLDALHLFSPYYYTCIYLDGKKTLLTESDIIMRLEKFDFATALTATVQCGDGHI